ncbi:MAG: CopG family transcriptional regulator [bacterium]|nr:CopG family transcriptional regulator [bacterium]
MSATTKRSTIYFDPVLHRALRIKSAELSRSVSDLVNEAVRESLSEDAEDLAAFDDRAHEPLVSYGDMLKKLRKDGQI